MEIAVVDDSLEYLNSMKELLKDYQDVKGNYYLNGEKFFCSLKNKKYDVVFLDIEMPDIDGIKLSEKLHQSGNNILVVFVTNHPETVYKAFGVNVIGFVRKNEVEKELPAIIKKVSQELSGRKTVQLQLKGNRTCRFTIEEVLCVEVELRNVYVYVQNMKYKLSERSIAKVFDLFVDSGFMFVNRSCFVNVRKIRILESDKLFLTGRKEPVYISRHKCKEVKREFMNIF